MTLYMHEVVPDVYRLDLPRPDLPAHVLASPDEPIGCHIITGDRTILFGTGYALSTAELLGELEKVAPIDIVIVEHGDSDHYGALHGLRDTHPDVTVAIPEDDQVHLLRINETPPDVLLNHGDERWGLTAITVRGHTYGNMAFIDQSRDILFAGDTLVRSTSDIAPDEPWSGPLAPPADRFNQHTQHARTNLITLADYSFDSVLLTHGNDVIGNAQSAFGKLLYDLDLHWDL